MSCDKYLEEKRLIMKAASEKKLTIFVGAGVSLDSGMPGWEEAVKEIGKCLGLNPISDADILKIPQYYYNQRGKKDYVELMRKIFKYGENLNISDTHKKIMEFDVETIVTTNYDHLLEKALRENGEFVNVVSKDIDIPYMKAGKKIIKMHGDFEKK